jgi:hypothetical protein
MILSNNNIVVKVLFKIHPIPFLSLPKPVRQ